MFSPEQKVSLCRYYDGTVLDSITLHDGMQGCTVGNKEGAFLLTNVALNPTTTVRHSMEA